MTLANAQLVELVKNGNFEEAQKLVNKKDYKIRLSYDTCSESPRDWDNLGMLYLDQGARYISIDELEYDLETMLEDENNIILNVYKYEHGGVAYSTSPFSCKWDSGQVGYIITNRKRLSKLGFNEELTDERIIGILKSEIDTFSKWANGEVYSFVIEDQFGEYVDSCSGFYSIEDMADHIDRDDFGFSTHEEMIEHLKTLDIGY